MKPAATLAAIAAALALSSPAAWAQSACDRYRAAYDQTFCFSRLLVASDKELNEVCKALSAQLKGDVRQGLTQVQRDWMAYRDAHCQPQPGTMAVDCNYRVNRDRTEYLRDRLRECRAGGCRADMLTRASW